METTDVFNAKKNILVPLINLAFFTFATGYFLVQYASSADAATLACIISSVFAGSASLFPLVASLRPSSVVILDDMLTVFGKNIERSSIISIVVLIAEVSIVYLNEKNIDKNITIKLKRFPEPEGDILAERLKSYLKN